MRAEFVMVGAEISDAKIERWRRWGLLPRPKQRGKGRGRGSTVVVPPQSAAQAIEIVRLFKIREKRDWVGWQLWLRGFPVDDRYWRPALSAARTMLFEVRNAALEHANKEDGPDLIQLREVVLAMTRGTPLYAPLAKLDREILETLIGFGVDVVQSEFIGFSHESDAKPNQSELQAVLDIFGARASERHSIAGHAIDFKGTIEGILRDLSGVLRNIEPNTTPLDPSIEIRREFVHAVETATLLYRFGIERFGRGAFGLGTMSRIAANPSISLQAAMLIFWIEMRRTSARLLLPDEIENLHGAVANISQNS